MRRKMALPVALLAVLAAGCGRGVEIEKVLKVIDVRSGWYDAGVQADGKNKLVPSLSIKLENVSSEPIANVQLMAVFHRVNEEEAWGEHYVRAIGRDELAPGATSDDVVLRARLGYTGTDPRKSMLRNSAFIDATVNVFAKHGSRNYVRLAQLEIDRELLTR
jgi:hypothetical protein